MSLEQYKKKNRNELWDVVVIQAEVIAELDLKSCTLDLTKGHLMQCEAALEDRDKRIAELEVKQRDIIRDIKVCFGRAVACDNNLLVNADAYNLLVATCNMQALKEQG